MKRLHLLILLFTLVPLLGWISSSTIAISTTPGEMAAFQQQSSGCDPSYPDLCIPPAPPDLDCKDINYRNFRVVGSDSHNFDRDRDGIGCEQ